jgi:hypothetical protein
MKRTFKSVALFGAATVVFAASSADDCEPWLSPNHGFSVCMPTGWFHRKMPSGSLFLCSESRGQCTTAVGGMPLKGQATLAALPGETIRHFKDGGSLAELAHAVADKDPSSRFSDLVELKGKFADVEYILVTQSLTTGATNESPKTQYLYFAKAGPHVLELVLTYNSRDRRAGEFQRTATDLLLSLEPK